MTGPRAASDQVGVTTSAEMTPADECPLSKCRFTFGGQCETHYSGCPEHDCDYCCPIFTDEEGS